VIDAVFATGTRFVRFEDNPDEGYANPSNDSWCQFSIDDVPTMYSARAIPNCNSTARRSLHELDLYVLRQLLMKCHPGVVLASGFLMSFVRCP
jgi:hypothetical protein